MSTRPTLMAAPTEAPAAAPSRAAPLMATPPPWYDGLEYALVGGLLKTDPNASLILLPAVFSGVAEFMVMMVRRKETPHREACWWITNTNAGCKPSRREI